MLDDVIEREAFTEALPVFFSVLAALIAYFAKRRSDELTRRREICAKALAAALGWLEIPYRIRRRQGGSASARTAVADFIHHLQEEQTYYQSWLRVEAPRIATAYGALCDAVKAASASAAQAGWRSTGVRSDEEMNIGRLEVGATANEEEAFLRQVRKDLSLWRGLWPW